MFKRSAFGALNKKSKIAKKVNATEKMEIQKLKKLVSEKEKQLKEERERKLAVERELGAERRLRLDAESQVDGLIAEINLAEQIGWKIYSKIKKNKIF